jgi:DNA-binding GntR family transcriptional regulator
MTTGSGHPVPPVERVLADRRGRRTAAADIASRVGVSVDLGLLHPLERLPRDEELATAFGVAPITVRRALRRLCQEGVLVRRRGRRGGTFVAADPPRPISPLFRAVVEATEEAILNAMLAAETITGRGGATAYALEPERLHAALRRD